MTPWQITIIAALFFTCGLAIGWLIGEAHGWFRRQKFEEVRKRTEKDFVTPPAYEK